MQRRGLSLIELLAVVAILSVLVTAGFAVLRLDSAGNFGAETVARTVADDLQTARRLAITTGDDHYLLLTTSGSSITGYTIYDDSSSAVDTYRKIPEQVTATISPSGSQTPSFTFEGQAASSFTITIAGPDRSFSVSVLATTGRPVVAEL